MADNFGILTPSGNKTLGAKDMGSSVLNPRVIPVVSDGNDIPGDVTYGQDVDVTRMAALVAGEAHIGNVGRSAVVLDFTPTLDTNQYADGDLLADTASLAGAVRVAAGIARLVSVHVLDENDQGAAFDIVFLDTANSLGTFNDAPSISDADARKIIGRVSIASGDYYDLGGCRIACKSDLSLLLKAAAASTAIYAALISRGTGTYTASGLKIKFGLEHVN